MRLYPAGAVGGQVVGFVGRDGTGLAGIEQTFEDELAGTAGQRRVEVGSGGNPIPSGHRRVDAGHRRRHRAADPRPGPAVRHRAAAGRRPAQDGATTRASAVVLDVHTGEVVAMGSCPGYDPGNYSKTDPDLLGNPVVSDVFEPGSVMKAVTLSAALEEGVATPDTVLTVNGHIEAGDRVVTDAHDHAPVDWTVTGILAKSSNVGTIMLAREVGDEKLEHYLRAFGLGSTTGIELPGESAGILQDSADWTASRAANVPIGQGVSVTTLQMASIYQTIANDGVRIEPRIVESVTTPDGRVTRGARAREHPGDQPGHRRRDGLHARGGRRPGRHRAARARSRASGWPGKTGTAQRANPACNCYEGGGYVTTFVGFAPADDPQYVVAVDLERPTSSAEGGQVAAPVFADVMRYALTADGVVPSGTPAPGLRPHRPPDQRRRGPAGRRGPPRGVPCAAEVRGPATRRR